MLHQANEPIACGHEDCTYTSLYPTVVGRHRRSAHGIAGSFPASVAVRDAKTKTTGKAAHVETDPLLGHVTFYAGYLTRAIEDYARGHDLPTETFTRRLGKHLSRTA